MKCGRWSMFHCWNVKQMNQSQTFRLHSKRVGGGVPGVVAVLFSPAEVAGL